MAPRGRALVHGRLLACLCVLLAGCNAASTPAPGSAVPSASGGAGPSGEQASPGESAAPAGAGPSSQDLIAADLAAGTIDLATSLVDRAYALFWDPRLPERYDGMGSVGEDASLVGDIRAAFPNLTTVQRSLLDPFLRRPTDPTSAWSTSGATAGGRVGEVRFAAFAAGDTPTACVAPRRWFSLDWSPDGDVDHGVEAWTCDVSADAAAPDLTSALATVEKLWPVEAADPPVGMGRPIPDNASPNHDANGKLDLYLLDPLAPCRPRNGSCEAIAGGLLAEAVGETTCGIPGYPANGCTSYLLLARARLKDSGFAGDFAHEFFHALQYAHAETTMADSWYAEATASWAEFQYVMRGGAFSQSERDESKDALWGHFRDWQNRTNSLLRIGGMLPYQAWMWPLFEGTKLEPGTIPTTWKALEAATDEADGDRIIDQALPFEQNFREFAVWNAQPAGYTWDKSTGLEDVSWQSKLNLGSLPRAPHLVTTDKQLANGTLSIPVNLEPLSAQYDTFAVTDQTVRQITIDVGHLSNVGNTDLDVLAQLVPKDQGPDAKDEWRRVAGQDHKVTFCRDSPDERVASLEVVISNHTLAAPIDPVPPNAVVNGSYTVKSKDKCDVPIAFDVQFSGSDSRGNTWHGTAHFQQHPTTDTLSECRIEAALVEYCYDFISGEATWTHAAIGQGETQGCAGTGSGPIAPAYGDGGNLKLTIVDEQDKELEGTYFGAIQVGFTSVVLINGTCTPAGQVITWMSAHGSPRPKITPGYKLAGENRISGDAGWQDWQWSMTPIFPDS